MFLVIFSHPCLIACSRHTVDTDTCHFVRECPLFLSAASINKLGFTDSLVLYKWRLNWSPTGAREGDWPEQIGKLEGICIGHGRSLANSLQSLFLWWVREFFFSAEFYWGGVKRQRRSLQADTFRKFPKLLQGTFNMCLKITTISGLLDFWNNEDY